METNISGFSTTIPNDTTHLSKNIHCNQLELEKYPQFITFVDQQLIKCGITTEFRKCFMDADSMKLFARAFTHETFDQTNNYNLLKFMGSGYIKTVMCSYIVRRWPEVQNDKFRAYSKIESRFQHNRTIMIIAQRRGFTLFFRADEKNIVKNANTLLNDVLESFIGALAQIIDNKVEYGLGYYYVQKFLISILDENPEDQSIDIGHISYGTFTDPVFKLNELYSAKRYKNPLLQALGWIGSETRKTLTDYFKTCIYQTLSTDNINAIEAEITTGAIVFDNSTNMLLYFNGKTWVEANKIHSKLQSIYPVIPDDDDDDDHSNHLDSNYLVSVVHTVVYNGQGVIIGQGFSIDEIESKNIAADKALRYMKAKGYDL